MIWDKIPTIEDYPDAFEEINKISRDQCTQEKLELLDKLNPRLWTKEMHDAWHINIPDTQAAFEAIINQLKEEIE